MLQPLLPTGKLIIQASIVLLQLGIIWQQYDVFVIMEAPVCDKIISKIFSTL
jgi:hypothetical protein